MRSSVKILGTSIGISIAIISGFILYGELTRPIGFVADEGRWVTGNGLSDGSRLVYRVEVENKIMVIDLTFKRVDGEWLSTVRVDNTTHNIRFKDNLVPLEIPEEFNEWSDIRGSLFWIIDYVYESKPLIGNAIWSSVTHGFRSYDLKVIAKESISTEAGEFESYKVAYYIGYQGGGELWIVKNMPLPVRAIITDADGSLMFRYELISYTL